MGGCWGCWVKLTWGLMTIGCGTAGAGAGGTGATGSMGWCWGWLFCAAVHHGICGICMRMPRSHCPCRLLLRMYFMIPCIMRVSMTPRTSPRMRLEPSSWAFQFRLKIPVLEVASVFLMISPNTELSHAPWISRGHTRGTAGFCWHRPAMCALLHMFCLIFQKKWVMTAPNKEARTMRMLAPWVCTELTSLILCS